MYATTGLFVSGRAYSPETVKHSIRRKEKFNPENRGAYFANGKPLHKTAREGGSRLDRFFDVLANNKSKRRTLADSVLDDIEVGKELYKGDLSDVADVLKAAEEQYNQL